MHARSFTAGLGDMVRVFDGKAGWIASPDRPFPLIPDHGRRYHRREGRRDDQLPDRLEGSSTRQWRVAEATIGDNDVLHARGNCRPAASVAVVFRRENGPAGARRAPHEYGDRVRSHAAGLRRTIAKLPEPA